MLEKGKQYETLIIDLGKDGQGIGRIDNFAVFVEGVLPGDYVNIKIIKIKKAYAFGELVEILQTSPDRVKPKCDVFKACGGCALQEYKYEEQLKLKTRIVKNSLERIGGFKNVEVSNIIAMEEPYYHRNKANFMIGEKDGKPVIGFYSAKSHDVVDVDICHIQNIKTADIIKVIKTYIAENNVTIYSENTREGLLRSVIVRTGHATGEIAVCFVINGEALPEQNDLIEKLISVGGMKSISVSVNRSRVNIDANRKPKLIWGGDFIADFIGGLKFEISIDSFFQVNSVQTEKLYKKAVGFAALTGKENVADAYCGIGAITLFLARKAGKVYGIEISETAVKDAYRNAEINNIPNVEFILGESEKIMPALQKDIKFDVIVIDPPRKGCDKKFIDAVLNVAPDRIVYISCDPATLSRDLKMFCEEKYYISEVQPVDMFPMSMHVEVVIKLQRKDCL